MSASFPLGSSVSYWIWAGSDMYGLHRTSTPKPGCIAVMGRNGNPADGNGPNGHTGWVIEAGSSITCIESRGGVGVCIKTRARSEWDGFITVDGMTPKVIAGMLDWEHLYDAVNGTLLHVTYYAGSGDNDHDGNPDRADIGDGNGIDCSGAVKLCGDYGFNHAANTPVPQPPPPPVTDDEEFSDVFWYEPDKSFHHIYVNPKTGDLIHVWAHGSENMTKRYGQGGIKPLPADAPVVAAVQPGTFGVVIEMSVVTADGYLLRGRFEGSPLTWHFGFVDPASAAA